MNDHSNGRETATDLEQRLSDEGVLYHMRDGHGFIVISDDRVFVVEEEDPNSLEGFIFKEVPNDDIFEYKVELGYPDEKYNGEEAEKVTENEKPCTHIRLFLPAHTVDCYVDGNPREVASAFVTHTVGT
jgi:hypothetical protein